MQPPPARKGPYLKTLKHVHTEQIARLQAKNQHECDLLEDIRNFTKQRSVIEKTYAENLLKLSSAYLNKKIPSIPDLRDEDEEEQWNVWNVWRTVLEENEKLARARLAAVEVFQQQITDDAKTIRQAKLSASKKCLDQLQVVQKEVQVSVSELDRFKKLYFEEEHLAHDARDKVRDVEEKLKKKKGSIFSSFTSLQRSSVKVKQAKFSSKKEACEEKSTGARNDYIISLALANAHSDRYFNVDLDGCIRVKTLEGDVYDKLKEYLTILGRTELLTCSAAQNSFTKIRDQAQMLSRDYNVMCCVQYYPVLKQHIRYPFDACDGDPCSKITCDHGAGTLLSGEAKKWATKVGKEVKVIREHQKKLVHLIQLKEQGQKTDPDDPNGPDLETRIDEFREIIRRAETEKAKAEGVIECLRDGDVNVDEWLQDIETLTTTVDMARSASSTSIKTDVSVSPGLPEFSKTSIRKKCQPQQAQEAFYDSDANDAVSESYRETETSSTEPVERDEDVEVQIEQERKRIEALSATWDDPLKMDWGEPSGGADESSEPPMQSPPPTGGTLSSGHRESWPSSDPAGGSESGLQKCVAIYTYVAQNPDELSIVENEHLELIGEGDGDGWVRARNYKGEEGYVPQNYVESEGISSMPGYPLQPQISFSSVDYHVQEPNAVVPPGDAQTDRVPPPAGMGGLDIVAEGMESGLIKEKGEPLQNGYGGGEAGDDDYNHQVVASEDVNVVPATSVSSGFTTPFINELRGEGGEFCRALYDYEGTGPEELSFYEGQIIRLLKRDDEDGWWEGEYDGMKGIFPCIVVEECRWDGEPLSPEEEEEEDEDDMYYDDDISESGIMPPSYTPPEIPSHLLPPETKVIVTQATPTVEHAIQQEEAASGEKTKKVEREAEQNFEMEMSGDQQQKYQTQFDEADMDAPTPPSGMPCASIVISEVPDVTISISGPEEHEDQETQNTDEDGLGVVQIEITAATPMSEEHRAFPGEEQKESPSPQKEIEPEPECEESSQPPEEEISEATSTQPEGFADFSGFSGFSDNFTDAFAPPPTTSSSSPAPVSAPPPPPVEKSGSVDSATAAFEKVAFRRQSEPEEDIGGGGLDSLQDSPDDPLASEPKVIEVIEPEEPYAAPMFSTMADPPIFSTMADAPIFSTMADARKSGPSTGSGSGSLDADQPPPGIGKRVESNESPATPEELDVQSLAKLESLKESDA